MARKRDISQLDQINEPSTSATIHAAVTSISPIKKGRLNTQFFDATLADTTSAVRLVGFSPQQQIQLNEIHKANSPVELSDCVVKLSSQGEGYDVMLKSNTQIRKSSRKLDMETIMASTLDCKPITLDMLQTLAQYEKVSVNVKVLQLLQTEQVGQDKKLKRDVLIADHTATAKVVLWEQQVDSLEKDKSYTLKNVHVKEFKSKKHLSIPKNDLEDTVDEIPADDEHTTLYNPQIIGVTDLDNYRSCLQCKARVEPQTPPLGKCTKEDCLMIQLFDLCQEQTTVRVMLRHVNNEGEYSHITCFAYGDLVYQLDNKPKNHPLTKSDFLKPKKLHEIQIITGKNIVTFVLRQS